MWSLHGEMRDLSTNKADLGRCKNPWIAIGRGICEPCGEGRHFVTAPVRSNLTENPGPRFGRLLANTARPASEAVSCPDVLFLFESWGTAGPSQVRLEALATLGLCGVVASSFHMARVAQMPNNSGHHLESDMLAVG